MQGKDRLLGATIPWSVADSTTAPWTGAKPGMSRLTMGV